MNITYELAVDERAGDKLAVDELLGLHLCPHPNTCAHFGIRCINLMYDLAVDKLAVDELAVDKLAVDKLAVDELLGSYSHVCM